MSDYGASESVAKEGWAITLAFLGACLFSGGLAYGADALQWILVVAGVVIFAYAIYLGFSVKPKGKGAL